MLFEPFEEQFDLPAALVKFCYRQRIEREVVCEEYQFSLIVDIVIVDASKRDRIVVRCQRAFQRNGLFAAKAMQRNWSKQGNFRKR